MANDKDYAIVIGIKDYLHLKSLQGPLQDALDFKEWLYSSAGGNIPNHEVDQAVLQHVFFIESSVSPLKPLQDDVDDCLDKILTNGAITGYRRFYFFFAGHGLGVSWSQNSLCLPKWSNRYVNAALSSADYLDVIVNSGLFAEVFFFLDCCRNRKIGAKPLHPQIGWPMPGHGVANCNSLVVYGSKFDNPSYEAVHWNDQELVVNGYLTRALIVGLKGAATNNQGEITIHTLKSFLKIKVEELAKAENKNQTVQFEDRFTQDAIVVSGFPNSLINVSIQFSTNGTYVLEDPDLNIIKTETNPTGNWTISLAKGTYTLTEQTTGKPYYFKIDGTINPFNYAVN